MKILGIDVGTKNLGYSIIERDSYGELTLFEAGVLKFRRANFKSQIVELNLFLDDLLSDSSGIESVAIEDIFFAYNPQSVLKLAQFKGAILMRVISSVGDYSEYTPSEIKRSITGNGRASSQSS